MTICLARDKVSIQIYSTETCELIRYIYLDYPIKSVAMPDHRNIVATVQQEANKGIKLVLMTTDYEQLIDAHLNKLP